MSQDSHASRRPAASRAEPATNGEPPRGRRLTLAAPFIFGAAWCALAWVMLLRGLGVFGALGPDEPRYASIAAEMLRRHAFITPRLWGRPWFEKPVLTYWLSALGDAVRGIGIAGSRLPNAVLALAGSLLLWWFLTRVHSARAGRLAAILSLTTAFWFAFGRAATTDMPLAATMAAGMVGLYLWWRERRRRWLALTGIALALATLAKGPVAVVLAGLSMLAFAATQRRFRDAFCCLTPISLGLYFAVAAPWYIAVQLRNPSFFRIFILQNNLQRFATNRYEHPQPLWFFLPVLLLALFPWTGWLGLPVRRAWRRLRQRGWKQFFDGRDSPLTFYLVFWTLAPLAFFSLSHSKLPSYILPSIPGAIALIAVAAAEAWEAMPRWTLLISAALVGVIPASLRIAPWLIAPRAQRVPASTILRDPSFLVLLAVTEILLLVLALRRRTLVLTLATCVLVAGAALALTSRPLSAAVDLSLSGRPLARQLQAQCSAGLPQTCNSVPVYVWNLNRDLRYGAQFNLAAALPDFPGPKAPTAAPENAIVLMDRSALMHFIAGFDSRWQMAPLGSMEPTPLDGIQSPWVVMRVRRRR